MAIDRRLDEIKEGAGLEDSRINQEFVDFIRKWSTPALLLLAVASLGWFLYNKQLEARKARVSEAFQQLNLSTQTSSPSPDALRRIAEDYSNVTGVRLLATTAAADEYLRAVRRGVKPGAELSQSGAPVNAEDALTPEDKERFLQEAEAMYRRVLEESADSAALAIHTLSAFYGLAAVAESRGEWGEAKNALDRAKELAEEHGYLEHIALAQRRIDALPSLAREITLYHEEQLPEIPALAPPEPEALEIDDSTNVIGPMPEDAEQADETESDAPPAEEDDAGGTVEGGDGGDADPDDDGSR